MRKPLQRSSREKDSAAVLGGVQGSSDTSHTDCTQEQDVVLTECGVGVPDSLERLWAPYRMRYIRNASGTQHADAAEDPFLAAPKQSDEDSLIVARGTTVYCLLNLYPYNVGHMMVVPYRQVANLEDLTTEESAEMMLFAQKAIRVLKSTNNPSGINVGFNLGHGSGGSIRDHLHMHIVPRWPGDANFMTLFGQVKVLSQLLRDTRAILAHAWLEQEKLAQGDCDA